MLWTPQGNDVQSMEGGWDTRLAFQTQPMEPGCGQGDGYGLISLDGRAVFSKQHGMQLSL